MAREIRRITKTISRYIPVGWEDEEKPLTITMRVLSQREVAHWLDQSSRLDLDSNQIILGTSVLEYDIARDTIIGWENLVVDGETIYFRFGSDGKFDESLIADLDMFEIISEAGRHILGVSRLP